jgi:hypothetical protein
MALLPQMGCEYQPAPPAIGAGSANWQFAQLPNHNYSEELRPMDYWRDYPISYRVKKWRKLPVCATRADVEKNFRDSGEEKPFRDLLIVPRT